MTDDQRFILVFGATGRQGGSVARALLKAGWPVRAFVSDPSKPAAIALRQAGAELMRGSFEETATIEAAMKGVRGVFSVLPGTLSAEDEVRYGKAIANLAAKSRVDHFVYSSGASVGEKLTGVPRFDAKPRIEAHIRDLPLTATIVRPMIFMEMLVRPGFGLEEGRLVSLIRPDQAMQLIAVEDIGKIVAALFANEAPFAGVAMKIAGDRVTGQELADAFTEVAGRPIAYARFPEEVLAANADLAQMASSLENGPLAEHVDLDFMRELNPDLLSFRSWLAGSGRAALGAALRNTGTAAATSGGSTGAGQ
ncbi:MULTISPECIES: NmrA/HSCARG family protein [unclassified Shinella]|uniref:NmrA/HSCARG family protein n=1 Tax=unclassified Shinella TaxID=2643062 RepID=UPI00225D4CEE|nr:MULTISPECIES: NmrA/HSCARG family protein [unclassified Shinella]CAI0334137.1 NmrA/HSCARG family protein [Rhizobiaceae bacterium]CAK7261790.1 NAD(P)H dehydrogenase (quinone) [Shinella sp. WSC3-e]MDC7259701.1 NmrA/HSCARG family protein [Shinella sp. YE25]MDC7266881.1 NmrA/HSCARG family protein [Shinella sp. HY16]MDC7273778.1 NmrA/HSCARG family protein [Shinella sp. YZ44]